MILSVISFILYDFGISILAIKSFKPMSNIPVLLNCFNNLNKVLEYLLCNSIKSFNSKRVKFLISSFNMNLNFSFTATVNVCLFKFIINVGNKTNMIISVSVSKEQVIFISLSFIFLISATNCFMELDFL